MILAKDETQSLARHTLVALGMLLVQLKVITEEGIVEAVAGVGFIVAGVVWALLDKRQQRKKLAAANAAIPPGATCPSCGCALHNEPKE